MDRKIIFSILTTIVLLFLVLFIKIEFLALALMSVFLLLILFSFKPEIGVYLIAFLLPFIYVSINLKVVDKSILIIDLLSMMVFLGFLARFVYLRIFTDKKIKIYFPVFVPFLFFFLATLVSSALSENVFKSLWFSFKYILSFYLFYIVLPYNVLKDDIGRIKKCLLSFISSALLFSVSSVVFFVIDWPQEFFRFKPINFFFQDKIIRYFSDNFGGLIEVYPYITEHTLLVETLLPAVFFAVVLKRLIQNERMKRALNLTIIFIFVVLVGTFSRGAWLSLIVCFMAFISYRMLSQRKNLKKYAIAAIIIFAISSPFFLHMYKLQTNQAIGGSSNSNRILSIQIAISAFEEKMYLGHGGGTYIEKIAANEDYKQKFGSPVDALGIWQKVLVEYGLAGVLTFTMFIFLILIVFIKSLKEFKEKEKFFIPMILACIGIFFFEFFNTSYYTGKLWFPIGMTLAIMSFYRQKKYAE